MKILNEGGFMILARYATVEEAQIIKALLDSMGVENQIVNATSAMIMPYIVKDVSIMVNAEDYDRARELLDAKFEGKDLVTREKK